MDDDTPSCEGSPWYIGQPGGAAAVLAADGAGDCADETAAVGAAFEACDTDGAEVAVLTNPEQAATARASRTSGPPAPSLAAPP
jgi:hypothetical protein